MGRSPGWCWSRVAHCGPSAIETALGCFCMYADAGEIPVNGHAESANEGQGDRSRVGMPAQGWGIGVGARPHGFLL